MKLFDFLVSAVADKITKSEKISELLNSSLEIVKNSQDIIESQNSMAKEINTVLSGFDTRIKALEVKHGKKVLKVKKDKMIIEEAK